MTDMNMSEKFQVKLVDFGANKINVIKHVRLQTDLGLKEAKDLVELAPGYLSYLPGEGTAPVVKEFDDEYAAQECAAILRRQGARIDVERVKVVISHQRELLPVDTSFEYREVLLKPHQTRLMVEILREKGIGFEQTIEHALNAYLADYEECSARDTYERSQVDHEVPWSPRVDSCAVEQYEDGCLHDLPF